LLSRGLLAWGKRDSLVAEIWLDAGLHAGVIPRDYPQVQVAVLRALLEVPSAETVFRPTSSHSGAVPIEERNQALAVHRALLAAAVADYGVVDILLAHASSPVLPGLEIEVPLAVVEFFASMLQASSLMPPGFVDYLQALQKQLQCRHAALWPFLAHFVDKLGQAGASTVTVRTFLRSCAALAVADVRPADPSSAWDFLRRCLSEQSSELADQVRNDPRNVASLIVFASCSGVAPGDTHLDTCIGSLPAEAHLQVKSSLGKWSVQAAAEPLLDAWTRLLVASSNGCGHAGPAPATAADEDDVEDDESAFLRLQRQQAHANALQAAQTAQLHHPWHRVSRRAQLSLLCLQLRP